MKLSNSQTLISDGVETEVLLSDFAQQLRCKKAGFPDIYFTLVDAAGLSPNPVLNQNAKTKERGNWVPLKMWTSESAKAVHAEWCCLWVCAQFSEN